MENLHDRRKIYEKAELLENQIKENPIEQFRNWFLEAEENPGISEANAMSVSTLEDDGCPRTRMVLLKSFTWEGFIFYTNYHSRKGIALQKSEKACLHFFWPALERQFIIKANLVMKNIISIYILTFMIYEIAQFHEHSRFFLKNRIASL